MDSESRSPCIVYLLNEILKNASVWRSAKMECGGLPWSFPERTPILAVHPSIQARVKRAQDTGFNLKFLPFSLDCHQLFVVRPFFKKKLSVNNRYGALIAQHLRKPVGRIHRQFDRRSFEDHPEQHMNIVLSRCDEHQGMLK